MFQKMLKAQGAELSNDDLQSLLDTYGRSNNTIDYVDLMRKVQSHSYEHAPTFALLTKPPPCCHYHSCTPGLSTAQPESALGTLQRAVHPVWSLQG